MGRFFLVLCSCLHLADSKLKLMKNVYWFVLACVLVVQSCTIQKRQHLPGYHFEWNSNNSPGEAHKYNKEKSVSVSPTDESSVITHELETQNIPPVNVTDVALETPESTQAKEQSAVNRKINQHDQSKGRRLTFPSIIHSPAKLLVGALNPENAPRTDGMSIVALVCGILSFLIPLVGLVLAILAIVFGAIGMGRTKRNPELKGRGMAIAGLVLGILGFLFVLLILALLSLSFGFTI